MYKKMSEALQHIAAQEGRANTHGVDPTVWKAPPPPEKLPYLEALQRKKEMEQRLGQLNYEIGDARRRFHTDERPMPRQAYSGLLKEQAKIKNELMECDVALAKMKLERVHAERSEKQTFYETFFQTAKMMLADDVFRTLLRAAGGTERR